MRYFTHIVPVLLTAIVLVGCKPAADSHEDLAKLPRTTYDKGGVRFSLANIEGFNTVNPDSVPWATYLPQTEENGQIAYYFVKGHARELASPQVRVEYFSKTLPNCGSEEELFSWLKTTFVNPERQGQVVGGDPVETMDNRKVNVLEIHTPVVNVGDSLQRSQKTMAWAYVEDGDRFVGFSFSSVDSAAYQEGFPMFRDLLRSYRDE